MADCLSRVVVLLWGDIPSRSGCLLGSVCCRVAFCKLVSCGCMFCSSHKRLFQCNWILSVLVLRIWSILVRFCCPFAIMLVVLCVPTIVPALLLCRHVVLWFIGFRRVSRGLLCLQRWCCLYYGIIFLEVHTGCYRLMLLNRRDVWGWFWNALLGCRFFDHRF